jgi:hypothetical protein
MAEAERCSELVNFSAISKAKELKEIKIARGMMVSSC